MVPTELPASSSGGGTPASEPASEWRRPATAAGRPAEAWPEGLVALYVERRTALVRLAYLLTSDREVAEEVVHDVVLAMRDRWDDITDPPAYVRTAVVNRCRSWLRRQRTAREHRPPRAEDVGLGADEMWDALGTLDERRRTAIVLRFYEDLPDAAIAEAIGCRPATVRTLVHRALHDLRKEMER